jgi:hypothetical protein
LASPPEFYADENSVTRSVRRLLTDLGYIFHSPAELYGSHEAALGARDEDWLAKVSSYRWTVLGRDLKIFERPSELAAYRASKLQVFLLPGQAPVSTNWSGSSRRIWPTSVLSPQLASPVPGG